MARITADFRQTSSRRFPDTPRFSMACTILSIIHVNNCAGMVRFRLDSPCYDFVHTSKMPSQYIPILIFALLAASFPALSFALLRRVRRKFPTASAPGGTPAEPEAREISAEDLVREKKSVGLPMVAMLFVIFAAAMMFLFPWAIKFSQMGWYGLIIVIVFLGILLCGYAWLSKKGALHWV
jgi:NADH-quinone oxidoreductase subunit A